MSAAPETIVSHVKAFRIRKGWSQTDLAERIQVRRQAIFDIESGRYLPNTAIALRLARVFECRVEDLFTESAASEIGAIHVVGNPVVGNPVTGNRASAPTRLVIGRIRDRLVGLPLVGKEAAFFGLRAAGGIFDPDRRRALMLAPPEKVEKTIFLMGCDPAFEILSHHVRRVAPDMRVHCGFASSHGALSGLAREEAHVAGVHLHNTGQEEANVVMAKEKSGLNVAVFGFSMMEEGLMVKTENPFGIRTVADLSGTGIRFVNREPGAALRVLLDDGLRQACMTGAEISGYDRVVTSHQDGAFQVACGMADAALGLRVVADAFGLGFVSLAWVRCDLVIPLDFHDHPTIRVLLDVLQTRALRLEIGVIAGYESGITGKRIDGNR